MRRLGQSALRPLARLAALTALAVCAAPAAASADAPASDTADPPGLDDRFAVHAQATDIFQYHPAFHSDFEGPQSFDRGNHTGNTFDATLYLGARLWPGAEFWVDPEMNQGIAPNDTLGIAGYVNGDGSKVGKAHPYTRFQRVFLRQTIDLGGDSETVQPDQNQFAERHTHDRLVITAGKFNATDVFDSNAYAHDPRRDFMNWSLIDAGSYDYAADAWGYSYGLAGEWYVGDWTLRGGLFDLSVVPNSQHLTPDLTQFQYDAELEHRHKLFGRDGAVRATLFVSRGRMGAYADAVALSEATGDAADTSLVRRYRSRPGVSVNVEQALTDDLGVFARAGWDDGTLESYEFTDIDRTVQAGLSLTGARWGRKADVVGLAGVVNAIAGVHEAYLDAGGLGILIGDGRLPHPETERIVESYYRVQLAPIAQLTLDGQFITNPAYNRDRGPVAVFGLRLHVQQ